MSYFGLALAAYWTAGILFALACTPRFLRDAAIIRARGERPLVSRSIWLAVALWPRYLAARPDRGKWREGTPRSIWFYRRPDYDRIEELERETYGDRPGG